MGADTPPDAAITTGSGAHAQPTDEVRPTRDAIRNTTSPGRRPATRSRGFVVRGRSETVMPNLGQRSPIAMEKKGKRIGIDATTLEANAALRSIVRRDNGESYEEFLKGSACQSGIETPTREHLARVDRKRKKKGSNKEWVNPHDRDARITKMKDGRTWPTRPSTPWTWKPERW
jgi:hypothetical protein